MSVANKFFATDFFLCLKNNVLNLKKLAWILNKFIKGIFLMEKNIVIKKS